METKHTPGPWKRAHHGHYNQIQIYTKNIYHPLAVVQNQEDMQANARLIAAAPDMLEALAAMVDMFERHIEGRSGPDDASNRWDMARAAIAKAEGK